MSSKRGKRGGSKKLSTVLLLKVRDATIDLQGCVGDKPTINGIMPMIMERLDEEERLEMLALAEKWRNKKGRGWSKAMIYDCMGEDYPGWDDEDGYDPYEEIYSALVDSEKSSKLKKLNKKLFKRMNKSGKGKKRYEYVGSAEDDFWENRKTMFRNGEWCDDLDDEDNYEHPEKVIKFYPDINNEMDIKEFHSLKEFSDFCGENGYFLSSVDYNHLVDWDVVHCCLDPISLEYGENEIITDNSYGALYWTVNDDGVKYDGVEARTLTD